MKNEAPERETPERILVSGFVWYDINDHYHHLRPNATEYIRADLATLSSDAVAGEEEADDEKPRYTTKRLRHEIARARENDARELDQLRDRVKAERAATIDAVLLTVGECLAGMDNGQVSPHARRKIEAAIHAARHGREGGKVDG